MARPRPKHLVVHMLLALALLGLTSAVASAQLCPPGKYSATGSAPCQDCTPGYYNDLFGATQCKACPAGRYNALPGASSCLLCGVGTYSLAASVQCTFCDAGTISSTPGSTACLACPDGTIAPNIGSSVCLECPQGTTSNASHTACVAQTPGAGGFAQGVMAMMILGSALLFIRRRQTA